MNTVNIFKMISMDPVLVIVPETNGYGENCQISVESLFSYNRLLCHLKSVMKDNRYNSETYILKLFLHKENSTNAKFLMMSL
jgi:hypothetical protein